MSDAMLVLFAEDDARLAGLTRQYLESHGVTVTHTANGNDALKQALSFRFDAVLLDVMLPDLDGMQVCMRIRAVSDVPILMITARNEEADRVMGLEIGADDYIVKPFSPRELLARIQANVRRARGRLNRPQNRLKVGDLELSPTSALATLAGEPLELTGYEFALLHALASNAGRVLNRDQLMEHAKGNAFESFDRSIDVHISRLRKKLGKGSNPSGRIRTVRGLGYMYLSEDR